MFHRKQSTLPELGDIEHIGVTLPVISEFGTVSPSLQCVSDKV